ncbi:MAG: hypothetical protein GY822_19700 [Deltaproteobacteria bacterium]|nr:hypothetical protein [Deltaproteobacteria bacterium]
MKKILPLSLLSTALVLLTAPASRAQLLNGDFSDGLNGWNLSVEGGDGPAGEVSVIDEGAQFKESSSFLVSLQQSFTVPPRAKGVAFSVSYAPGFDTSGGDVPDAFEAFLLDEANAPLVDGWRQGATSFYRKGDDGREGKSIGVNVSNNEVQFSLAHMPEEALVQLRFHLLGGDDDQGSIVHLSAVRLLNQDNQSPTAAGGPDLNDACTGSLVLNASSSSDPENDALSYTWRNELGAPVAEGISPTLQLPLGRHILTLVVKDVFGAQSTDTIEVQFEACVDAGTPRTDGGNAPRDAGTPIVDGGNINPRDAGTPSVDGGNVNPRDAGPLLDDAGSATQDAGTLGAGDSDGGQQTQTDGGTGGNVAADCSCRAQRTAQTRPPWALFAVLFMGVVLRKRRSRRR